VKSDNRQKAGPDKIFEASLGACIESSAQLETVDASNFEWGLNALETRPINETSDAI
jgi:hypothetical protein